MRRRQGGEMFEFRGLKTSLYLILVLQFTALTKHNCASFVVRVGDEVTLPCKNVRDDQVKCDSTTWLFSDSSRRTVELVRDGQIYKDEASKSKSDRLSVTEKCSLVIKNVTDEDVGHYACRQTYQLQQRYEDELVYLSVITITEHKNDSMVTLKCSVSTRGRCGHTVKWLYQGQDVDKDHNELRTSRSGCWATVSFKTSHFIYSSSNNKLLKCKVTDENTGEEQLFPFSPLSSDWWWYIILAVGLTALLIAVVALIGWKRYKGNKRETDENMAVPDDGVSYASISYARETDREAQIWGGDDAVTYSKVKAPSSSAGASADPSDLYATVNNSNI
ncbi:uncharacterized protein LOC120788793 [Xiphias gladius]|uniref:uncharacterized protein LOC120788793 n=1 Tax=Xiphias gladius TaxID=8245 RepID=UPI001A98A020|nr:uncharacterized protein LOC120788793 [Xiphias gladius]